MTYVIRTKREEAKRSWWTGKFFARRQYAQEYDSMDDASKALSTAKARCYVDVEIVESK